MQLVRDEKLMNIPKYSDRLMRDKGRQTKARNLKKARKLKRKVETKFDVKGVAVKP